MDNHRMGDDGHVWREYADDEVLHWSLCDRCRDSYQAPLSASHWCPACDGEQEEHSDDYQLTNLSLDRLERGQQYDLGGGARVEAFFVLRYGLLLPCDHVSSGRRPAGLGEKCHFCRNGIGEGQRVFIAETHMDDLWHYDTEALGWLLDEYSDYTLGDDSGARNNHRFNAEIAENDRHDRASLPPPSDPVWKPHDEYGPDDVYDYYFEQQLFLDEFHQQKDSYAPYVVVDPTRDNDDQRGLFYYYNRGRAWDAYLHARSQSSRAQFLVCDELVVRAKVDRRVDDRDGRERTARTAESLALELEVARPDAEADMRDWLAEG